MKKYNLSKIMKRAWELVKKVWNDHFSWPQGSMEGSKEYDRRIEKES